MNMDPNALMVQMLLDRQADIVNLRAELEQAHEEIERLRAALVETPAE